jgi:hypothetical protein
VGRTSRNIVAAAVAVVLIAAVVAVLAIVNSGDDSDGASATAGSEKVATAPVAKTDETQSPTTEHDMAAMDHGAEHADAQGGGATEHAHVDGPNMQYADFPADTRAQLDVVRSIIEKYPTAADAEKDGWTAATINLRGIAAHFLHGGPGGFLGIDDKFDVNNPEILLFDGTTPDSPIVGVSYLVAGDTPEGFAGPYDVWHRHNAVCFAHGLVIGEIDGAQGSKIDIGSDGCKAQGGFVFPIANLSMIHVWMKPGFESSHGVFSHDHPQLDNPTRT